MSKPLVYIAGPISKPDPLINVRSAIILYQRLINDDVVTPFCPHLSILVPLVAGGAETSDHEYWLKHDFEVIDHCAAVYRMHGASVGADQEMEYATGTLGIPTFRTLDGLYGWAQLRWSGFRPRGMIG